MATTDSKKPARSAVSSLITSHNARSKNETLPYEILHNLQHQHGWRDLKLHAITNETQLLELPNSKLHSSQSRSRDDELIYLISGLPPRHSYLHPDFQNHLLRNSMSETSIVVQREWVLPMSLSEKWSLKKFCKVFDTLPLREPLTANGADLQLQWRDARRVLLGMLAANGMGGDGTVAYYIMQEGEVKPRQNG